jgi:hypothetical protein
VEAGERRQKRNRRCIPAKKNENTKTNYVATGKLTDVEAGKRRRKHELWGSYGQGYAPISEMTEVEKGERRRRRSYVPIGEMAEVEKGEHRRERREQSRRRVLAKRQKQNVGRLKKQRAPETCHEQRRN